MQLLCAVKKACLNTLYDQLENGTLSLDMIMTLLVQVGGVIQRHSDGGEGSTFVKYTNSCLG